MKRVLQSLFGLLAIISLIAAVVWLIRSVAPVPQAETLTQPTTTPNQPENVMTPTPKATRISTATPTTIVESSTDLTIPLTATIEHPVEPTIEPITKSIASTETHPLSEPTATLAFDTLTVVSTDEIIPSSERSVGTLADGTAIPVGLRVDWSPDGKKALVAREVTSAHILSRSDGEAYSPLSAMDLWVWNKKTEQEIEVTDKAFYWDWSPDGQAIVYITAVGDKGLDGELRIFDLNTKTGQKIVDTDITQAYPGPFWLSNGEIIYMDDAQFWIMQSDGSNRRSLNDLKVYRDEAVDAGRIEYSYAPNKVGGRLYLSPDETRIAYTTLSSIEPYLVYQLQLVDLSGGNYVAMENEAGFRAWSSDGIFFLYQVPIPSDRIFGDLWIADQDGSNRQRLLDASEWGKGIDYVYSDVKNRPGMIEHITLSPDNRFIVFSELNEGGIWLLDIASAKWRLLYQDENLQPFTSLEWPTNDELIASFVSGPFRTDQRYFRLRLGNED